MTCDNPDLWGLGGVILIAIAFGMLMQWLISGDKDRTP